MYGKSALPYFVFFKSTLSTLKHSVLILVVGLLCACGGGGGGGSGGGGSSSSTPKLTANAGADVTVNMGTRVTLDPKVLVANASGYKLSANGVELTGSSTNDQHVVKLVWQKLEGPDFGLSASSLNDGVIYFNAPATASTATIVFKLILTNAAGATAEDSITITVKHVNLKPEVNAGTSLEVKAGTQVTLDGSGSKDTDGSIAKYNWQQKSGTTVTLSNQSTAKASFTAPAVTANTDLQFELTVEDNEGATAAQTVTVKVTPADVPEVAIFFPPAVGVYSGTSISAFGSAKAKDANLTSVTLELGSAQINATLASDGTWRADNLTIPAGTTATLKAIATDSLGRSGQATATINKSGVVGSGPDIDDIIGFEVDSALNKLLLLSTGDTLGSTRLLSIDLANGKRSADISNFGNSQQGPTNEALVTTAYDPVSKQLYVTGAPADTSVSPFVIAIDTATGQRKLITSNSKGTGATLMLPYGVAFAKGNLYVADNNTDKILKVDLQTGNRVTHADTNTYLYGIDAPTLLAVDSVAANPLLYMMPNATHNYIMGLTIDTDVTLSDAITNSMEFGSGPALMDMPLSISADDSQNKIYVLTQYSDLIEVDTLTGKRKEMAGDYFSVEKMTYDPVKRVIYMIDDFPLEVSAVDPVTGQAVVLSR